jgi:DNA-directed RNA polymerase subunit RPC12/RpoP
MVRTIVCPDCGSYNTNKVPVKRPSGPQKAGRTLIKPRKENNKYKCIDCGLEFYESELRE